jgi:hypothetical protein
MKTFKLNLLLIILIILIGQNLVFGQNDNRKKLQKIIKQKFIEKLEISDSLGDKFFELYNKSLKDIRTLNKEKKELMETMENNLEATDMKSKTDRFFEINQLIENSKNDFYDKLKTIFTYKQIAQTLIFQKNLKQFLNKELKKKSNEF